MNDIFHFFLHIEDKYTKKRDTLFIFHEDFPAFFVIYVIAIHYYGAAGGVLQLVKATEECGFAAAGWTDDYHNLSLVDIYAYTLKDFQLAKILL